MKQNNPAFRSRSSSRSSSLLHLIAAAGLVAACTVWPNKAAAQISTNDATVKQNGTDNVAEVEQTLTAHYPQEAVIYQSGAENEIYVVQTGSGDQRLDVSQVGNNNSVTTHQEETNEFSSGPSDILMHIEGDRNEVVVDQDNNSLGEFKLTLVSGSDNYVNIYQTGENADISLKHQQSNNNSDTIRQRAGGGLIEISRYYTDSSSTEIAQDAFGETLFIEQGHSDYATAQVDQLGNFRGDITIRQVDSHTVLADLDQLAWDSEMTVNQTDTTASQAYISQDMSSYGGSDLIAAIYQRNGTDAGYAEINQAGLENSALIEQCNVMGATALIQQDGIGNYAEIIQTTGSFNTATIAQAGENYSASIQQGGIFNSATINQL